MKFSLVALAALATTTAASNWFGTKPVYNKWHETELERWLSDNNVPYPTPADRKDLEDLIKTNWDASVVQPYTAWETPQLSKWMSAKGYQVKKGTEQNKNSLISQVKGYWSETEQSATDAYENVKDFIFDSWTDSQLKAFLDRHGVPNPQPRTRDSLLSTARDNYQSIAKKTNEYTSYPGNWLYQSWSESDLKAYLDERGIPVPQPSSRDKLVASVRRNAHIASTKYAAASKSAASSVAAATESLTDALFESWSDSKIKEWADKNGVKVPQGSKRNELLALARKHRAQISGDNVSASAASAYGAATSKAGNQYAQATDGAAYQGQQVQNYAYEWFNWAKAQIGLGASTASYYATQATASGKSAASVASGSAASAASVASGSAASAASLASASAASAASVASGSAYSGAAAATDNAAAAASIASASAASLASAASASVYSGANAASSSGSSAISYASDAAGKSASSAASVASKSASSAALIASKSASSASVVAAKSLSSFSSSLSSAASSASSSASKAASKSGSKAAKKAGDAASESLSSAKHRVQEAAQKATDYAKEEL